MKHLLGLWRSIFQAMNGKKSESESSGNDESDVDAEERVQKAEELNHVRILNDNNKTLNKSITRTLPKV